MNPLETAIAALRDALTVHASDKAELTAAQNVLAPLQLKASASGQKVNATVDGLTALAASMKV